jgi:hypothetical protein
MAMGVCVCVCGGGGVVEAYDNINSVMSRSGRIMYATIPGICLHRCNEQKFVFAGNKIFILMDH